MTENDILHLLFKPYGGVMIDSDVAFVERYGRRFYPKAMRELAKQLHRLTAKITKMCPPGMFEYQLMHYTKKASDRYVIMESLRDVQDIQGLNIAIQPTTQEERKIFTECFKDETGTTTSPVQNVVMYLEDSLENENYKWENARMKNGQEALPVLLEIIAFLKTIKSACRVHNFEVTHSPLGIIFTLTLISPRVLSYYTRIDWILA